MSPAPTVPNLSKGRCRATNNPKLTPGIDGRASSARRYRDIMSDLAASLPAAPTPTQTLLIKSATGLACMIEDQAAAIARGERVDLAVYANACGHLSRLIERITGGTAAIVAAAKPHVPTPEEIALRYAPKETPTPPKHAHVRFDLMSDAELDQYVERNGITNDKCLAEIERREERRDAAAHEQSTDLDEHTTDDQPKAEVDPDAFEHLL